MRYWIVALALIAAVLTGLALRPDIASSAWSVLSGESVEQLAAYVRGFGVWAPLASIGLMVLQAIIAPLPGSLIATANGAIFGVWLGGLISWIGGLAGATASFWIGRRLARGLVVSRLDSRALEWVDRIAGRHGFRIVLLARLIPGISFDAISYAAGVSSIGFGPFMLASAIGMIPGTLMFALFGHDLARAGDHTWRLSLLLALALVGVLLGRWWLTRLSSTAAEHDQPPAPIESKDDG